MPELPGNVGFFSRCEILSSWDCTVIMCWRRLSRQITVGNDRLPESVTFYDTDICPGRSTIHHFENVCWGITRLEYLSGLRDGAGNYTHWGLARVHGELAAAKALAEEHRLVTSHVLAMPMSYLLEDLEQSSQQAGSACLDLPRTASPAGTGAVAHGPCCGYALHLNSALHALSCLAEGSPRVRQSPNRIATPTTCPITSAS